MKRYEQHQINRAKELYLDWTKVSEISKLTGIDRSTIYYYIKKEWGTERAQICVESLDNIKASKDSKMVDIIDSGLNIIRRNLKHLDSSKSDLSIQELKTITSVMTDVDKVRKLDYKKATSISAIEESGDSDEKDKKVHDPFLGIDDNDVSDLEHDESLAAKKTIN